MRIPRYSLRTLLLLVTICAVVAAVLKWEADASREFEEKDSIVTAAIREALPAVDQELLKNWIREAKEKNPTFDAWQHDWGYLKHSEQVMVTPFGSEGGQRGMFHEWRIVRAMDPVTTNYSQAILRRDRETRVDVKIRCARPNDLLSRHTSISIVENPAPDNSLLIERLKAALDRQGVAYEIQGERQSPETKSK